MPRAIWNGAISFGLVSVPVKLYSAVTSRSISFHQLHRDTHARVKNKRVSATTGDEVAYEDIVKGYEIAPEQYVIISPEELEALMPKKSRAIQIEEFVDLTQIDPLYFQNAYYLAPDESVKKPYKLLVDAMDKAGKVAIARFVMRTKEYLAAIRAKDGVLVMSTMLHADELVSPDRIDGFEDLDDVSITKKELALANQLIDSLSEEFAPDKFHDDYREALIDLIERKAAGEEIIIEPTSEEPEKVVDLMAALEASLAGASDGDEATAAAG